jgi:murein L,D-transpeptidase YafK
VQKEHGTLLVFKLKEKIGMYITPEETYVFEIASGSAKGQKEREGDNRTPKGEYYISHSGICSKYGRFLYISYPNFEDALKGLDKGIISQEEFNKIATANKKKLPPPPTPLGYDILIHSDGEIEMGDEKVKVSTEFNWTAGCIAVKEKDRDYLYRKVRKGTFVKISE